MELKRTPRSTVCTRSPILLLTVHYIVWVFSLVICEFGRQYNQFARKGSSSHCVSYMHIWYTVSCHTNELSLHSGKKEASEIYFYLDWFHGKLAWSCAVAVFTVVAYDCYIFIFKWKTPVIHSCSIAYYLISVAFCLAYVSCWQCTFCDCN